MKIAQYDIGGGKYECIMIAPASDEAHRTAARVSEYVEIEFTPLQREQVVNQQITALDNLRAEVAREFGEKLADIDRRKSELLAITHEGTST